MTGAEVSERGVHSAAVALCGARPGPRGEEDDEGAAARLDEPGLEVRGRGGWRAEVEDRVARAASGCGTERAALCAAAEAEDDVEARAEVLLNPAGQRVDELVHAAFVVAQVHALESHLGSKFVTRNQ